MRVSPKTLVPARSRQCLHTTISPLCSTPQLLTRAAIQPVEKVCHCAEYPENHQNQKQASQQTQLLQSLLANHPHSSYTSLIALPPLPATIKHCSWLCAIMRSGLGRTTFFSFYHLQFNHCVSEFLSFHQDQARLKRECGTRIV